MDIVILPQHWSAVLCIFIMIGVLFVAAKKKWMMTYALIVANLIIFIITSIFREEVIFGIGDFSGAYSGLGGLGFRSIYLTSELYPQTYTLFTSMFIHGGFAHIFGNMFILFFVGVPFEQRVGWKKFIIIYLLTGMFGALAHSFLDLQSYIPLVGASGAIFGIMGAFAFSYPRDEVIMPIGIGIMFLTRIKVMYAVLFFAAIETFVVWLDVQDSTAHVAHIGGLLAGFILAAILIRGNKTHTKKGETIFYDSYQPKRMDNIDFSKLRPLATTAELKDMLRRIENETVPQVRDIWLEHFVERAVCPKCGDKIFRMENRIWCEKCGFKTRY